MAAIERNAFYDLVAKALAHLYDLPYLQTHILGEILIENPAREGRGRALQQILLEAIQALQPTIDSAGSAHAWRTYRYLFLRYVQARAPLDVANDLMISARQSRRTYRDAVDALASLLWDRALARDLLDRGDVASRSELALTVAAPALAPRSVTPGVEQSAKPDTVGGTLPAPVCCSTSLSDVLAEIASTISQCAAASGSEWSLAVSPALPAVRVERVSLSQILLNLSMASLAHMRGRLRIGADHSAGLVRLAFELIAGQPTDASVGQTVDDHLDLARRLIEIAGGSLDIRKTGDGAMVLVATFQSVHQPTVLVIEDNPDVVSVFQRYLESAGLAVVAAAEGEDGFRKASALHPSAITLDVMMNGQSGWETLQLLKNHPTTHDIPVLICSVLRDGELAQFLGANELLPKPVTRPMLLAALTRCGLPVLL